MAGTACVLAPDPLVTVTVELRPVKPGTGND
jgi:hypothetical protein